MKPPLLDLFEWFNNSPLGAGIRASTWWYPILELVHSLGIIVLLGSIWMVDLRLLGLILRSRRVSDVAGRLLPWTWAGFAIQSASGILLSLSEAKRLYYIPYFWMKLALLVLAGLNALLFHFGVYRDVAKWDGTRVTPPLARMAGAVSIGVWILVIGAGRAIGYAL
ncbi:MAG TPA: DUF6644 family protein [Bryobacteraceae bacterium]|nr:DUF6644 family protein [Bryobacteraceae bacterium]